MAGIAHTRFNRFHTLPSTDPGYTLYYSQPKTSHIEPHNIIWEKKEEHFTARDDQEATRIMCEFLGKEKIVLRTGTHLRVATRLIADHPYRIVRDFFPDSRKIDRAS